MKPGFLAVTEVFATLQGEGAHTGLPTVFIRLYGCPLRCSWCDSMYSVEKGVFHQREVGGVGDEAVQIRYRTGANRVCLTGGEPLSQKATPELVAWLLNNGFWVDVETSGAVDIEPACRVAERVGYRDRLCMVMDIKLQSSGGGYRQQDFWTLSRNFNYLLPHDQVKFVVSSETDLPDVKFWLDLLQNRKEPLPQFLLSPVGASPSLGGRLARAILDHRLPARLSMQMHKVVQIP